MFAGAAREAVFSNAEVIRRVTTDFISVALKAALVNNPPPGLEGALYAEVGRSKPAPQGICVANSAGKVLAWSLMFDNDASVLAFLDHAMKRYIEFPDADRPVPAQRFMRFPSLPLADVPDTTGSLRLAERHVDERCPAKPGLSEGTLVGRLIGRALDKNGTPVANTIRQENYAEARFEVPVSAQQECADLFRRGGADPIELPDSFARALVAPAYLGQLDVNPLGSQPGGKNDRACWEFRARRVGSDDGPLRRFHIEGRSEVAGGQSALGQRSDGRMWQHEVRLDWEGYVDVDTQQRRFTRLVVLARGDEKLRWGNPRLWAEKEADIAHLPAGRPIDVECRVIYGLTAEPCSADEVVKDAARVGPLFQRADGPPASLAAKMKRFQSSLRRFQRDGGNLSEIQPRMQRFGQLVEQRQFKEAEAVLQQAIELVEHPLGEEDLP